jgi:hypothetical protein
MPIADYPPGSVPASGSDRFDRTPDYGPMQNQKKVRSDNEDPPEPPKGTNPPAA